MKPTFPPRQLPQANGSEAAVEIGYGREPSLLHRPASASAGDERTKAFQTADGSNYDVAIFGAGISGARIFHELCRQGYRVLLLDHGDFAGGTSQASGMMIWGGILYLKDFDFRTVRKLCRARDRLIEQMPGKVRAESLRYLRGGMTQRNRHIVRAGMMLYWLLGSRRRRFPECEADFAERVMLKADQFRDSFTFEEAVLKMSDCRFALEWILPFLGPQTAALNHCATESANFDAAAGHWRLELRDRLHGHEAAVSARFVVNAAGVWTDTLNERLGIASPYRHELSKGVYISFRRPDSLRQTLVFDTGENNDAMTFAPWGPVALCGPTETRLTEIGDGFSVAPADVRWLLRMANQNLHTRYGAEDVVSMRCGIRSLAVRRGFSKTAHPSEFSRKHLVHYDRARQAIAVYGGKITSCGQMADEVRARLSPHLRPAQVCLPPLPKAPSTEFFPGLTEPVPSAAWCSEREHCHTLEDYLRRRTNIAQWIPRGGWGVRSENAETLRQIARAFCRSETDVDESIAACQRRVREQHDDILAAV